MRTKNFKNRLVSVALMAAMVFASLGFIGFGDNAYAAENEITVYVTVSNAGDLAADADGNYMVNMPVTVQADSQGLATVDAVLAAFHDTYYPGGYATTNTAYGLSVTKLWGVENGGSYLFAINGTKCNSGVGYDYMKDGDALTAVVMKDLTYWADLIAAFDKSAVTAQPGEEVELTLSYDEVTYDANWNPSHVAKPVAEAKVFLAGAADSIIGTTDDAGKVKVSFDEPGTYIVTASGTVAMQVQDWSQNGAYVDTDAPISAPACIITVETEQEDDPINEEQDDEEQDAVVNGDEEDDAVVESDGEKDEKKSAEKAPATGDDSQMAVYLMLMVAAASAALVLRRQK